MTLVEQVRAMICDHPDDNFTLTELAEEIVSLVKEAAVKAVEEVQFKYDGKTSPRQEAATAIRELR